MSAVDEIAPGLQARLGRAVQQARLPGASAGVVYDGRLAWTGAVGFAERSSRRRPDAGTLYRIASITKTFTAVAIMQLRDAGRLRLDDPLVGHLPSSSGRRTRSGRSRT